MAILLFALYQMVFWAIVTPLDKALEGSSDLLTNVLSTALALLTILPIIVIPLLYLVFR
jgi:hypothetical protein